MISDADFKTLEDILRQDSGLAVTREKEYLLESRLHPLAVKHDAQDLSGLARKLRAGGAPDLRRAVVEAMTTNETSFFRDMTPFQKLKDEVLPAMIRARAAQKTLRIWSAASSSGQEPYSIAMMLKDYGPALAGWQIDILATDLSHDILAQAKSGVYSQFEVQRGLPIQLLVKYFTQAGDKWTIKPDIGSMVTFKPFNLLSDTPPSGMGFDIVFCRNVLIYFDVKDKARALKTVKQAMRQDGVLFLGGAETIIGVTDDFRMHPDVKGCYVRDDSTFQAVAKTAI